MRFETHRGPQDAVGDWPVWHNSRRRPGYMSPMQYEQHWLAGQPKTVNP